jgi:hypothetical protein
MSPSQDDLASQLEVALHQRRHLLPNDFAPGRAAYRIATSYRERADGGSAFWIARPRWTGGDGRLVGHAVFEVLRVDGRAGVWDAGTRDEAEVIADALTTLSL